MKQPHTPLILTANALLDGQVVYWSDHSGWVGFIEHASLFFDADKAGARLATITTTDTGVIGPYLFNATTAKGTARALHFREVFRATGPSNRWLGKQSARSPEPQHV